MKYSLIGLLFLTGCGSPKIIMVNPSNDLPVKNLKIGDKYPLNEELGGKIGASVTIELKCKVTKDDDEYLYTYIAINTSEKKPILFGWEIMDRASYNGHGAPLMWKLGPKETITLRLKHKEEPVWVTGSAYMWNLADAREKMWVDHFKETNVELPKRLFVHQTSFGHPGPLPASFAKASP